MSSLPTQGFTSPPTSDDDLLDIPIAHPHARNSTLHVGTPDDAHSRTHSAHIRKRKQKLVVFEDEMEGSDAQASSMTSSIRRLSVNSAEIVLQVDPFMQGGAPLRRTHSNERPKVVEKYVAIQSLRSPTVLRPVCQGEAVAYCTSSWFHRRALFHYLKARYQYTEDVHSEVQLFPELIYCRYKAPHKADERRRRYHSDASAQALVRSNEGEYGRMLENPVTMESVVFENVLHAHKDDEDDAWEQHETEEPSINLEDQSILQEVFYFDYGVVVMWGLNSEQQRAELEMLHAFQSDSLDKDSQNALAFDIVVDPKVAQRVADGVIFMHDMEDHRTRMTISYVLSQSVKLQVYEQILSATIDAYSHVPPFIAKTGEVCLTRKQSNAFTGELYVLNSAITLVSNIMDTPTTMWEENESLTLLYKAIRKYLQMGRRLEIVEERFNVMDEVCSYVKEDINNYVEVKLYWWVIILLAVDALVMVIETNLDFLD